MNNVLIHDADGDEFNTDAYEYDSERNRLKFRNPPTGNWLVIDDVKITIDITGFLIEISCTNIN